MNIFTADKKELQIHLLSFKCLKLNFVYNINSKENLSINLLITFLCHRTVFVHIISSSCLFPTYILLFRVEWEEIRGLIIPIVWILSAPGHNIFPVTNHRILSTSFDRWDFTKPRWSLTNIITEIQQKCQSKGDQESQGEGTWGGQVRILNKVIKIVFIEMVTFEARLAEGEKVNHVNGWGENLLSFQAGGTVRAKALKWEHAWNVWGVTRRLVWL